MHKIYGRFLALYIVIFASIFILASSIAVLCTFPDEINVIQGQSKKLNDSLIFNLVLDNGQQNNIELQCASKLVSSFTLIHGNNQGRTKGRVMLLNILPIKQVAVNVIPDLKLVPSGEAIGVKIEARGLLVVGMSSINGTDGRRHSPAADAGFEIGDILLEINGKKIDNERDIIEYLNNRKNNEDNVEIVIERSKSKMTIPVKPVLSQDENTYKIGLWVRDCIAGVGTLTFYDPKSKVFGALGHGITDSDSGALIDVDRGSIMKSSVASVQKARKTAPGEIIGLFYDGKEAYGKIEKNTNYGIYGKLNNLKDNKRTKPISVGLSYQVKEGPAKILTTIEENKIEEFDILIQKVVRQNNAGSKSMLIRITDPRLIEKTGGIVQGMSGSPIIQDGKLIGAVTHVLINDPTRGYGIFIEWMLDEADISLKNEYKAAAGQ
ncbi:MAG: SpoIVB peptidase [Bacillota bacterium]